LRNLAPIAAFIALIAACAALPTPQSFDEQLAAAYGAHTAVVQAAAAALKGGTISTAEAIEVEHQAQSSRAMLDAARALESSNTAGAQNDLTLASSALTALQSYLNQQAKK
jgi:hypothetical protein